MNVQNALPSYQVMATNHIYLVLKDHVTHHELRDFCRTLDFVLSAEGWSTENLLTNPLVAQRTDSPANSYSKGNVLAWLIQQRGQTAAVRSAPNVEPQDGKLHITLAYLKGEYVSDEDRVHCV